jgi:predicted nucleic acid-binding protein
LNLAAYDVAYIELALRKNLAIATVDGNLKAAALAEGANVLSL